MYNGGDDDDNFCVDGIARAQAVVSFTYLDGSVRTLLFAMALEDHYPSRFLDFVSLFADPTFFFSLGAHHVASALSAICDRRKSVASSQRLGSDQGQLAQLIPRTWSHVFADGGFTRSDNDRDITVLDYKPFFAASVDSILIFEEGKDRPPSGGNSDRSSFPILQLRRSRHATDVRVGWTSQLRTELEAPRDGSIQTRKLSVAVHVLGILPSGALRSTLRICTALERARKDPLLSALSKNKGAPSEPSAMYIRRSGCVPVPAAYPLERGMGHLPLRIDVATVFPKLWLGRFALHAWAEGELGDAAMPMPMALFEHKLFRTKCATVAIAIAPVLLPPPPTAFPSREVCLDGSPAGDTVAQAIGKATWTDGTTWSPKVRMEQCISAIRFIIILLDTSLSLSYSLSGPWILCSFFISLTTHI
jgi:hypothetical protein